MRQVLYKMLQDLNQEKKPFCFLMPAAEAIYRPFQFAFIYDQPVWKPEDEPEKDLEKCPVDLAKKAEKMCIRDRLYQMNLTAGLQHPL